jgi:CBS domain-containing protein
MLPNPLGLSLEAEVRSLMAVEVHKIHLESTVSDAVAVMLAKDIGSLVVAGSDGPVGIITERDILRKVTGARADPGKVKVKEVMSSPLISINAETSVGDAAKKMVENGIRRLGVTDDDGALAGLVTMTDIVSYVAKREELSDSLISYLMHDVV